MQGSRGELFRRVNYLRDDPYRTSSARQVHLHANTSHTFHVTAVVCTSMPVEALGVTYSQRCSVIYFEVLTSGDPFTIDYLVHTHMAYVP